MRDRQYGRLTSDFILSMWRDCPKGADLSSILARRCIPAILLSLILRPLACGSHLHQLGIKLVKMAPAGERPED